ncbi:AAA family ATPase [Enterobacter sp. CFBP8995]|nr:AAA family ATPase [Enterobacter sp. CFBP8995]
MIKSIKVERNELFLTTRDDGKDNVFDVDSMSLIIGENGSGKTYFFRQVINEFRSSHVGAFTGDCTINFHGQQNKYSDQETRDWGVVYYSPVPHRPKFHPSSRFKDASPNYNKKFNVISLLDYKDIIEEFGIRPNVVLKANVDARSEIKWLIASMKESDNNFIGKIFNVPSLIKKFIEMDLDIKRDLQPKTTAEKNAFLKDKEKLLEDLVDEILDKLNSVLLDDGVKAFVITLNAKRKNGSFKRVAAIQILAQFLNSTMVEINSSSKRSFYQFHDDYNKVKIFLAMYKNNLNLLDGPGIPVDPYMASSLLKSHSVEECFSLEFSDMSTGELSFLLQVSSLASSLIAMSSKKIKSFLILIDEGDAFLHLEWQRKYINQLNKLLGYLKVKLGIKTLQIILATHSPLLATDIPKEYICIMDDGKVKSGFAAPIHILLNESFGSKTIGEFASNRINELVDSITNGELSERDCVVLKSIDNEIIKRELDRIMRDNGVMP